MKIYYLAFCLLFLSLSVAACGKPRLVQTQPLTPITVQLKYYHQAQFAGFYAADQNGYYADEGLQVSFLKGGPTVDLEQAVLAGTAQFGLTAGELLITGRAEGKPLRAIAVIFRRNPFVFMTLASSGISRPQDIVGKRVQYNATTRVLLNAMLDRFGITPDQYTEVDVDADLDSFYAGKVDVWNAFLTNEVLAARSAGYAVNVINPDDYGIHFYSDTLYARDDFIDANPELVLRFLRATLQGWTYAIENPEKAGAMIAKYNPKADLTHETEQMIASLPLINTGEEHIGWMKPEVWADMEETLRRQTVLTAPLDVTQVYTMHFLKEIYK